MGLNNYLKLEKLGRGAIGIVFKAQNKSTGEFVALKRIRVDNEEEGIPCTAIREISLLKEIQHDNIVKLYDVIYTDRKLTLVFEFAETDLKKYLDYEQQPLAIGTVKAFLYQLLQGIQYCHSKKIMHRDLKPGNLLITKSGTLKIADFGLARAYGIPVRAYSSEVVTLWYRAPDILLGNTNYTDSIDMWSIGCIFAEMLLRTPLFPGANPTEQIDLIFKCLGTPEAIPPFEITSHRYPPQDLAILFAHCPEEGRLLLFEMLQCIPTDRISASNALLSSFFTNLELDHIAIPTTTSKFATLPDFLK